MFLLFPLVSRDIMFSHLYTAFLLILTTQRGLDYKSYFNHTYRALLCTLKALYLPYNQSTNTNRLNKLIHEASNVVAVELDSDGGVRKTVAVQVQGIYWAFFHTHFDVLPSPFSLSACSIGSPLSTLWQRDC